MAIFLVALALIAALALGALFAVEAYPQSRFWAPPAGPLHVALSSFGVETLDPSLDTQDGLRYHAHMYDHLIGADGRGRIYGAESSGYGLVDSWAVSSDARTYTLELRQGARWHDGEPISAQDVGASFKHYFREGAVCGVCGNLRDKVAQVNTNGERSVEIELAAPDVAFLGLLAPIEGDVPLLPEHILNSENNGVDKTLSDTPVGSGAWRFAERIQGERIEYEANADYWDAERLPAYDRLHIVQAPDEHVRVALMRTGEADIAPVGADAVAIMKQAGFAIDGPKNVVATTIRFLQSYDAAYLTSDLRFRKALALSVDMPQIIAEVYPPEAATVATDALFTPISPGIDANLTAYQQDTAAAQALITDVGYDGETVTLLSLVAYGISEMPRINEMIAAQWNAVGVNAQVVPTEWPLLQPSILARPQQLGEYGAAPALHGAAPSRPGGDINSVRRYLSGADGAMLTYFDPAAGDAALSALTAASDSGARAALLQSLARKAYDEYWAIPVMWRHHTYALSPRLTGWDPTDGTASDLRFETVRPNETQ